MINTLPKRVAALILVVAVGLVGCRGGSTNNESGLPETLGGLELTRVIQGDKAARIVDEMHGKRLGAAAYAVGYYGARNVLYLSLYDSGEAARSDLMKMAAKMAKDSGPFTPIETIGKMDLGVRFRTEGMGLTHYFYRTGSILLWWQVAHEKAGSTYMDLAAHDFSSFSS